VTRPKEDTMKDIKHDGGDEKLRGQYYLVLGQNNTEKGFIKCFNSSAHTQQRVSADRRENCSKVNKAFAFSFH
jgi:hypothetical protein